MNSGTVALSAHAQDSGPVMSGTTYMVFKNGEPGGQHEVVRSRLEEPKFDLPAGQYRVAAVLGLARVEKDITVGPGETQKHNLVLDAGGIRLASVLAGTVPHSIAIFSTGCMVSLQRTARPTRN